MRLDQGLSWRQGSRPQSVNEMQDLGEQRSGDSDLTNKDTGEKVRKEVPIRMRRWWWNDDTGKVMTEVRYGNKPLELQRGKPTIEIGESYCRKLVTVCSGGVLNLLDSVLESHSLDDFGEMI